MFTTLIDGTGNPSPTYVDRDVQPEKRYVYRIQARNAAGLSSRSRRFVADTAVAPVVRSDPGVPGEQPVARAQQTCPGSEDSPEPVTVPVTAVPIVVTSTTAEYFVLYVSHDVDGATVDIPVLVKRGEAGTTTLAENVAALPTASLPLIEKNLSLYIPNKKLPTTREIVPLLRESRIPLLFAEDVIPGGNFLALNPGEGYGRLQVLDPDDRPHSRDVVIYEALPNELPRVAGTISTVPQTPLSHVNLRAIQNGVPNAFVRDVLDQPGITELIGKLRPLCGDRQRLGPACGHV